MLEQSLEGADSFLRPLTQNVDRKMPKTESKT